VCTFLGGLLFRLTYECVGVSLSSQRRQEPMRMSSKCFLLICKRFANLLQITFSSFLKVACRGDNFIHVGFIIFVARLATSSDDTFLVLLKKFLRFLLWNPLLKPRVLCVSTTLLKMTFQTRPSKYLFGFLSEMLTMCWVFFS
jgi:hypothetical protein